MTLEHARGSLELDHCLVMGILNRTPDSFYDGGRMDMAEALDHAQGMLSEGADLIDVGAVKAGPGENVPVEEELARLVPLVDGLRDIGVPLSVETSRPEIARAALEAGAAIVNDVTGRADPELIEVVADARAAIVLMHSGGQIRGRPRGPRYDDVVGSVIGEWRRMAAVANAHGVSDDRIIVDAGLDFGKTTFQSLELMRRLDEQVAEAWPLLVAPSRKDVVGESLDLPPGERLEGTLALVALSAAAGASFVRVHDVRAAVRTVHMVETVQGVRPPAAPVRGLWD